MVEARENRIPIMMSDAELNAIDDWRFQHRVATRANAVRKLMAVGMLTMKGMDAFLEKANRALDGVVDAEKEIEAFLERLPHESQISREQALEIAFLYSELIGKGGYDQLWELYRSAADLSESIGHEFAPRRRILLSRNSLHEMVSSLLRRVMGKRTMEPKK
ncbi:MULTISPECIES: hypothetical protein [unclassified Mesorhizobium]|uniref:hypothetical protein n=1 Tax=unclassified Mesorhizobium TaxID=325217 RepID=UPI001093E8C2|nr:MULTISPECIES: hypothetical protein [unclassified Mesorhizobium]TGS47556.1 hypothetical protein EN825_00885 [Mesorhizobium sp. M8A.F.Ca.ET.182.01.1.1]TGS84155.1 hypothetical protein EN824_07245 [Mesorhizobium sp. M8A.F.Ca.ET.181.01.1.1]